MPLRREAPEDFCGSQAEARSQRAAQDLPGLRVRRRQVLPHARRGAPPQGSAARTSWSAASSRPCRPEVEALLRNLEVDSAHRSRRTAAAIDRRGAAAAPSRRCASSTAWPTTTRPAAATPPAGRTSRNCWKPASRSSPPSTSSTWRSCGEQVEAITGKHVSETVPVAFIRSADEIESWTPRPKTAGARARRAARTPSGAQQQLSKLRELTLVLAAEVVDQQLERYLDRHGIEQHYGTQERMLVCITPRANVREHDRHGADHRRPLPRRADRGLRQPGADLGGGPGGARRKAGDRARGAGPGSRFWTARIPSRPFCEFARPAASRSCSSATRQRSGIWPRLWGGPVDKLIRGVARDGRAGLSAITR